MKISQTKIYIGEREDKPSLGGAPLNSNWKGLPDTLETESIEIPGYAALLGKNEGAPSQN